MFFYVTCYGHRVSFEFLSLIHNFWNRLPVFSIQLEVYVHGKLNYFWRLLIVERRELASHLVQYFSCNGQMSKHFLLKSSTFVDVNSCRRVLHFNVKRYTATKIIISNPVKYFLVRVNFHGHKTRMSSQYVDSHTENRCRRILVFKFLIFSIVFAVGQLEKRYWTYRMIYWRSRKVFPLCSCTAEHKLIGIICQYSEPDSVSL